MIGNMEVRAGHVVCSTNVLINVSDASGNFDMSIISLPHVWLISRSDAGADVVLVRPSPTNTYMFSVFTGVSYF